MIANKEKRQFHRAIDSLNAILRTIQEKLPEAEFEFNPVDKEIRLVSSPSQNNGKKKAKNVLVRSFLDGDPKED